MEVIARTFDCMSNEENAGTLKIFCYSEDFLIAGIVIPSFGCTESSYRFFIIEQIRAKKVVEKGKNHLF
jgi:hypothetical protein